MTDLHESMNQFHQFEFTLSLVLMMMLGISMIRKDTVKPSYAWMNTLPVDRSFVWIAKWSAGIWYCFMFIWLALIIYGITGAVFQVPTSQLLLNGVEYLIIIIYGLSFGLSITLGMTLGAWIRNRSVYIVGLCIWIFGTYVIDLILVGDMHLFPIRTIRLSSASIVTNNTKIVLKKQADDELGFDVSISLQIPDAELSTFPDNGTISWNYMDYNKDIRMIRRSVGDVPDHISSYDNMKVEQFLT